jgi:hypothetical protein
MANVGPNLAASIRVPRTHYMDYLKHPHEKTFSFKTIDTKPVEKAIDHDQLSTILLKITYYFQVNMASGLNILRTLLPQNWWIGSLNRLMMIINHWQFTWI